jgi:hypothetical protein
MTMMMKVIKVVMEGLVEGGAAPNDLPPNLIMRARLMM